MRLKKRLWLVGLLCGVQFEARAVYEVGDAVGSHCWDSGTLAPVCLEYAPDTVRVLLFNAGWCGPCNSELSELSPQVHQFDADPVLFVSVSSEGWTSNAKPDATFLTEWREKHDFDFPAVGSFRDSGKAFFTSSAIPKVAIVGKDGRLLYKAVGPAVSTVLAEVRKALKQ